MRLGHRAQTSAPPAQVWALLGDPRRWPSFNPFVRKVQGSPSRVRSGDTLLAIARVTGLRIPVDVVEARPEERLELFFHTAPGVSERVVFELTPTTRGGTALRVTVVVEGLFARPAWAPLWMANGLVARVLAAQVEKEARAVRRQQRGAA